MSSGPVNRRLGWLGVGAPLLLLPTLALWVSSVLWVFTPRPAGSAEITSQAQQRKIPGRLRCVSEELRGALLLRESLPASGLRLPSAEQIASLYRSLPESLRGRIDPEIDARRLVGAQDWRKNKERPWEAYGTLTLETWSRAAQEVRDLAVAGPGSLELSGSLLRRLHSLAADGLVFRGFEGRRIRERYRKGELSEDEARVLLRRAFERGEEVAGTPHSAWVGKFRSDPLDQIEHRGSFFDKDGSRYFTTEELEAVRSNPYMTLDEKSVHQKSPGVWLAEARYLEVSKIEQAVETVLARANESLKTARTQRERIGIVVEMQKDLVSIHPFLDGNGRTVRLLCDLVYESHGLPPPLYANENELTLTKEQAIGHVLDGMLAYTLVQLGRK